MNHVTRILAAIMLIPILCYCQNEEPETQDPQPEPDPEPVDTTEYKFNQDIGQTLTGSMILFKSEADDNGVAMQGFGFDNDRNVYISDSPSDSTGSHCRVRKFDEAGLLLSEMKLPSSAHGDGFDVEPVGEDVNIWTSVTAGAGNGGFKGLVPASAGIRLIARFVFKEGATAYAEDAAELFYLGDNGCRYVDVDMDHGLFAATAYIDSTSLVYVFNMEDMRKAPLKEVEVTRPTAVPGTKVSAYDLTQIAPVAKFAFTQADYTGYKVDGKTVRAIQGFCVYDDRVYFTAGFKGDDNIITAVDFTGAKKIDRQVMGIVKNVSSLKSLGVSSTGEVETEGVDIRKGQMYIGLHGAHYVESIIKLRD